MADRKAFVLLGIFALCLFPVFAQALPGDPFQGQSFFIDREGDEIRFIQRLIWEEAAYAFRYVVIVERQEHDGSYREVFRGSTRETFIDVSLDAGQYRFRVEVYDLMDEFAFSTAWQDFEVVRVFQPELTGFSPQAFFLDTGEAWELTLYGENLLSDADFYLVQGGVRIMPERHTSTGDSAHLVFDLRSLIPGQYYIHVINPGGLDAKIGTFAITFQRPFDLNISLGFAPIIPLYGFLFADFEFNNSTIEAPFPAGLYMLGAIARINFIPFKRHWGQLGLELSSSITVLEHERAYHTANAFFINTHLSFLYQRYFWGRNFAFNINLGAGLSTLMNFHYTYPVGPQTEQKTPHYISSIAGVSFKGFFIDPFFISAGADFIHLFSPEGSMPGFIRSFVAVGVRR